MVLLLLLLIAIVSPRVRDGGRHFALAAWYIVGDCAVAATGRRAEETAGSHPGRHTEF